MRGEPFILRFDDRCGGSADERVVLGKLLTSDFLPSASRFRGGVREFSNELKTSSLHQQGRIISHEGQAVFLE